jgi:hypothetical protein
MIVERQTGPRALTSFIEAGPQPELARRRLDPRHEAFWRDAERELFLLKDGKGRVLGRIAAIRRPATPEQATFGWLETPDDPGAATALIDGAAGWAAARGARRLVGPLHLGFGIELGALVEGFSPPPSPLAPTNPPHLAGLLERAGLIPVHTRHGYTWNAHDIPAPAYVLREAAHEAGIDYRPAQRTAVTEEAGRFLAVYNAARAGRLGTVPLALETARALVREAMVFGDPRLMWLAEVDGVPAGLVIGVPLAADGSTAESPGGQGTLARLRAVLRSRKLARVHLAALAVAPAFSGRGIEAQLLLRAWRGALDLGIDSAELGGVDTEAPDTEALLWRLGAHRVRRYVIYQRELQ